MTDKVYLKREWIPITFTGGEVTVGVSGKAREWCIDIDNRGNQDSKDKVYVRTYDDDDQQLGEKVVHPDQLVRVCLSGTRMRVQGVSYEQTIKYAFPWVLYSAG